MRSAGRSGGWRIAIGLVGAGCTQVNPVYEGTDGGESTGGATATVITGDDAPAACARDPDCADDEFCNGVERCEPASPLADARGCIAGPSPCEGGCDEAREQCTDACAGDPDADGDGLVPVECGGLDCDDEQWGFALGDWANCGECGRSCDSEQACEGGECITARRVFVTSAAYTGNLGGLEGADARCQAHADAAGLDGVFLAYVFGPFAGGERFERPELPFVRLDGVRVANGWADLSDESLAAAIEIDEQRMTAVGNAWTGRVNVVGNPENNHCSNWTYDQTGCLEPGVPCGGAGEVPTLDAHWDGYYVFNCSDAYRLYCIEQGAG